MNEMKGSKERNCCHRAIKYIVAESGNCQTNLIILGELTSSFPLLLDFLLNDGGVQRGNGDRFCRCDQGPGVRDPCGYKVGE